MIPLYGISNLLITLTSLAISIFVFTKGYKDKTNKIWCLLSLSIGVYGFGAYTVSLARSWQEAFFWWRISFIGIILIPVFFMHFVYSLLDIKRPRILKGIYCMTLFLWLLNIFRPDLFLRNVTLFFANSKIFKSGYWVYPPTLFYIFYIIFLFVGIIIWTHIDLIRGYKKAGFLKRYQLKYIILGSTIGFIGGGTSFFPSFNIHLYPVLNITVALYPIIVGYAMVKYRLMDIKVAVTRTGIFIAVYTLVLGLPFLLLTSGKHWLIQFLGINWWAGPLVLLTVLATAGPFFYIYLQKRAEAILLREQLRYRETLRQAAREMARIHNLKKLLNLIVHTVTKTVGVSHSAIYLFNPKSEQFLLEASRNLKKEQVSSIDKKNPLILWLAEYREALVYEEVNRRSQEDLGSIFKDLEEQLRLLNAVVVVPGFLKDRLIGFLLLGDKRSGKIYSSEDLNTFSLLAHQATLAIENALIYENIEEQVRQRTEELIAVQKQLVQAEKLATMGTLAGGVAHEINNPLTAILTNVQMLLAEDSSDSKLDRESLELIEEATKRCRSIVQKLMTYAKRPLESAQVSEVNLLGVVKNVASFLNYQLEQENVKIITEAKDKEYVVLGNQNELEQVVTNIVLNANDSIRQIKNSGDIHITLLKSGDWIKIVIRDEGAGISKEIMPKIFDPFFTTKDVGRGLGLGLSICQAIVEKHNGMITAQSQANKGSIFTVQLPKIGKLEKVNEKYPAY